MSDCHDPTTNRELAGRREEFRRRTGTYLRLGHDLFAAARFVADSGGRLAGPVLDVGTGKGIIAVELARRGFRVVSIDPDDSDQALASLLAREAGMRGRIRFVRGDGARLPFPAGRSNWWPGFTGKKAGTMCAAGSPWSRRWRNFRDSASGAQSDATGNCTGWRCS